ncbi:MAG: hypothetical protein PF513_02425 [Tenericutes bacterium]|jgi:predicted ribosomally synthesized peptide with SipW-like signal peptide|nr:hypothetical protein [Mycoplasmatota bacterium]
MRSKKLVIGLLLLLAVVFTTGTFAYWASIDNTEVTGATIQIGSGREVTVTASLGAIDVSLVPVGEVDNSNELNAASSVTLTYTLSYTDTAVYATDASYTVSLSNYSLGSITETRILELFSFSETADLTITAGTDETITILVTFLTAPADQAEYDIIIANDLTFDVTFDVTQPTQ